MRAHIEKQCAERACQANDEKEQITLVLDVNAMHITGWFAFMRKTEGAHGKIRSERTIQTYARSLRAFCHWLVRRKLITVNPF